MSKILNASVVSSILFIISACSSSNDKQIRSVYKKLNTMESDISKLKNEMEIVKSKRAIRMPTGAPTRRANERPNTENITNDKSSYDYALGLYKDGEINGAINAFEQFNSRYPNSKQQKNVLYYIGSASYTQRNYNRAEQALEELVFQNNNTGEVSSRAIGLLKNVYTAQGKQDKISRLNEFLNPSPEPAPAMIPSNSNITIESAIDTNIDVNRPTYNVGSEPESLERKYPYN